MTASNSPHDGGGFPPTQWSLVMRARDGGQLTSWIALETLCGIYWPPVCAFVRCRGHSIHDAKDLTQAFFTDLLSRPFLANVGPQKGKFRSFLLASLEHFLSNERRRQRAAKRGGDPPPFFIDVTEIESVLAGDTAGHLTPGELFDRQWALALLDSVLTSLKADYESRGQGEVFEAIAGRLLKDDETSYREIAGRLGMKEGAVKVAAHRLRLRYQSKLRAEVARTVSDESEIDGELNELKDAFRSVAKPEFP